MSEPYRACALIPTFDNAMTIAGVVTETRRHIREILIVDDGSGDEGRQATVAIELRGHARVTRRPRNGGKGAAVKTGFAVAREMGFTHALQIDADGQHDPDDIPRFLALSSENPRAAVLGHPIFDASTPRGRRAAHQLTNFWTSIETGGKFVTDPQCGYRVYPLDAALRTTVGADRMAFDIEIAVRLVWAGVPIINVPTRVRYLPRAAGGVSHFRVVRDNLAISGMHAHLVLIALLRRFRHVRRLSP
jgi:glycosyltransferase involved in cell wall biosynthesis